MADQLTKKKFLLDEEVSRLEETLKSNYKKKPRDCLLIELLLKTGCRASELLALKKQDMYNKSRSIHITGLKGSDGREMYLHNFLYDRLKKYAASVDGEYIFSIKIRRLQGIWYKFRPCAKRIHCLRHTFAIIVYRETKDIQLVQQALGHRSIVNTMIYSQYFYSQDEFRKIPNINFFKPSKGA